MIVTIYMHSVVRLCNYYSYCKYVHCRGLMCIPLVSAFPYHMCLVNKETLIARMFSQTELQNFFSIFSVNVFILTMFESRCTLSLHPCVKQLF